jgi:hypothetical protein
MLGRGLLYAALATLSVIACSARAAPATFLGVTDCFPLGAPCAFRPHTAGQPIDFWVYALDANYQIATDYVGTVSITSSDSKAVLPASHTYTAADNSVFQFTVTINSVPTGGGYAVQGPAVVATDANGLTGSAQFFFFPTPVPEPAPTLSTEFALLLAALLGLASVISLRIPLRAKLPNYSFNATVTCRGENPAPGAAR